MRLNMAPDPPRIFLGRRLTHWIPLYVMMSVLPGALQGGASDRLGKTVQIERFKRSSIISRASIAPDEGTFAVVGPARYPSFLGHNG